MPSSARRRSPAAVWSVDDASTFAAQKEFKLLQLLSTDKKAFSTARRLGLFSARPQPQQTARSGAAAKAAPVRRKPNAASGRSAEPNSRQRRSALRSARRHAQLQVQVYRTAIAILYICRLRRRCRLRSDLADLESLENSVHDDDSGFQVRLVSVSSALMEVSRSRRRDRPPSASSSAASSTSSLGSAALPGGFYQARCPPALLQMGGQRKQQRTAVPAPPYAGRM